MKLIHFQGLNCYQNAVISIAAHMGVDYRPAFAALWSEADFVYDDNHGVYISTRMLENLESLGVETETLRCDSEEVAAVILSAIEVGESFLVGMDTFNISWTTGYGAVHDVHYFAARKENPQRLLCFDPTYGKEYQQAEIHDITPYTSRICRVKRGEGNPFNASASHEAREVLSSHPKTRVRLLEELDRCVDKRHQNPLLLAKYVDTMLNNRYLFKYYLDNDVLCRNKYPELFDKDLFLGWAAVKNGLYKAYIAKQNQDTICDVSKLFSKLIDTELAIAEKILSLS